MMMICSSRVVVVVVVVKVAVRIGIGGRVLKFGWLI